MPDDGASHSGLTHIQNVERICNDIIKGDRQAIPLNQVEIFILLCSIYLHDIGRMYKNRYKSRKREAVDDYLFDEDGTYIAPKARSLQKIERAIDALTQEIAKDTQEKKAAITEKHLDQNIKDALDGEADPHHAFYSYYYILMHHNEMGLFDEHIAQQVALVSLLHERKIADKLLSTMFLDNVCVERFGPLRIAWLGAILALADEMDISYHRTLPEFLIKDLFASQTATKKADLRQQIVGCTIDLTSRSLLVFPSEKLLSKKGVLLQKFIEDLQNKMSLIKTWWPIYKQMDLEIRACRVSFNGHLFKSVEGNLRLALEPNLAQYKLLNVINAMFRLRFGVFGKSYFSWQMLSNESGIHDIEQLKMIARRLERLSGLWSRPLRDEAEQHPSDPLIPEYFKNNNDKFILRIVPMDGEWTLNIVLPEKPSNQKSNDNQVETVKTQFVTALKSLFEEEADNG
ncbi:MAG: hypothetical protein P9M14_03285 [Candidatus Alcyoniella australis]|nr:hypothetical protein [Candidatus Alcyoniella australis]